MNRTPKMYKQWIRRHIVVHAEERTEWGDVSRMVTMDGCFVTILFGDATVEADSRVRWLFERGVVNVYAPKDFSDVFKSDVACVGYCEDSDEFIGWSHRAWNSFGIGHKSLPGDLECTSGYVAGYLETHPEYDFRIKPGFVCRTLEDCKMVAFAYAEAVG